MFTRDGYDPTRHAVSQLSNGDLGWIQIANFLITGAMTVAAAVGVRRALGRGRLSAWASGLLGAYGLGVFCAGIFRADPSDGFPPGTPTGMGEVSWHGLAHFAVAGLGFLCLVAACLVMGAWFARGNEAGWAWYSRVTGVVFAGELRRVVVRLGRGRNDSRVHGGGGRCLGVAGGGVGQALPNSGVAADARVCGRDGKRWIIGTGRC